MKRVRIGWGTFATGLALVATLALAGPALAHALPQSSDPGAGATLATPPTQVTITFGERPDPKLSTIKVLDTSGKLVTSGPTALALDNALTLTVPLGPLPTGVYTVAWRTVSAVDGHEAAGSFSFGVGVAPTTSTAGAGAAEVESSSGSAAGALSRFLLYVGLIGLFGAGFVGAAVHPRPPRSIVRLAAGSWLLSAIGAVGVIAVQLGDSGADIGTFMSSALGGLVISRLGVVAGSGMVVAVLIAWRWAWERSLFVLAAVSAAGGMFVDVVAGHAAAGDLAGLQVIAQWAHILAVGSWVGGLAALLLSVRGSVADEKTIAIRRFSRWAGFALAAIAATGLLRAIQEVGTLDALVTSDFGRLVIAKSALLGVLALLGATNHFVSVPAAARSLGLLRRIGRVELGVGIVVLLLTGLLVNLAPPSSKAAASAPRPAPAVIVEGHDFGTSVKVRLEASPGTAGFNTFRATVTDYDTGAPVAADLVTLRFSIPALSDVGGSRLDLDPSGVGTFAGNGANLSLEGAWEIAALVAHGTSSVEVPLQLITDVAPAHVEVNSVAGLPTISTVHLSAGRTVQVYLDPGRAGANEVHVTFFDAAGTELPVQTVALSLGPSGGALAALTPRLLERGHFAAETTLPAGTYTLSLSGSAPNGDALTTQLDLTVTN